MVEGIGQYAGRVASRRSLLGLAAAVLGGSAGSAQAQLQPWPSRPVRVVVPYPAGGPTDVLARLLAERFHAAFGLSSAQRRGPWWRSVACRFRPLFRFVLDRQRQPPDRRGLRAGFGSTHIPYRGSAPALTDLLGGRLDFMAFAYASISQQIAASRQGRLSAA